MDNKVTVVSAFVPLNVLHMSADQYHELGERMFQAAREAGANTSFIQSSLDYCWSHDLCIGKPPATETPADRYATPEDHVKSHIVQHTRTQWALDAKSAYPDTDVVIWLDLGILKQGKWNNKPIIADDVKWFVEAVQKYPFEGDMPFPGITGPEPWLPRGNNWRFCGSTHIWPVKWLTQIDNGYRQALRDFVSTYGCVPLDLTIWPLVERLRGVPFKWYQAEYDYTQLRNFPCVP